MKTSLATIAVLLIAASASAQSAEEQTPRQTARWDFVMDDRPSLRFGDTLRVDLTGMADFEWRDLDGTAGDRTGFGRRRIGIDGRVLDVFAFEVERDLGDTADPWRDVLVEFRKYRALRVRAGHFKIPFGAERLASVRSLDFARRSVVTETLTPARDTGMEINGRVLGDVLSYMAGVFRHDGTGAPDQVHERWTGGTTAAGRIVVAPFARSRTKLLRRIEAGGGYTRGDIAEGLNSLALETMNGFEAFAPIYVAGTRQRAGLDASLVHRTFSVRGEFLRVWDQRLGQGLAGDDLPDLVADGWHVSGTWTAIGSLKSSGAPTDPLFRGGFGTLQFAGRFETLGFGSDAAWDDAFRNPRAANVLANDFRAWTAGINWHPVRHVKLQLNVVREHLGDAERRPDAGRAWSTNRLFRMQFSL
jgi:phosphate-selective porin OprO and OprP